MLHKIRSFYFDAIIKSAREYLKEFDKESGRFLENGGWALSRQDPMLAYAYLYKTKGAGNEFYNKSETLDVVIKAVQALRDFQYPDGQLEFVKTDGSRFGPIYMPWTFYHWLETYDLLKDDISPVRKKDWEIGMFPAFEAFYDGGSLAHRTSNINLWNIMSLHRAGEIFDNKEWVNTANLRITEYIDYQTPEGYWEEFKGPTTGYNQVYIHALALYKFHGGSVDVTDVLRKALRFHQAFTYPDGSAVETIDGRRQYHKPGWSGPSVVLPSGYPGFIATRGGAELLASRFDYLDKKTTPLPHAASLLIMLDSLIADKNREKQFVDEYMGYPNATDKEFSVSHGKGGIVRKAGVQTVLSAYTAPVAESDFSIDRCSFVSIWTEKDGLILGSGNSKNLLNHCSFVIIDKNTRKAVSHVPKSGKLVSENHIVLDYEYATCEISTDIKSNGEVSLSYLTKPVSDEYDWYINLPLRPDFTFNNSDIKVKHNKIENIIEFLKARVKFCEDFEITMPSFAPSPYYQNEKSRTDEWLATVSVYPKGNSIKIIIT